MDKPLTHREILAFFDVAQTKRELYANGGNDRAMREAEALWQHGVDALLDFALHVLAREDLQERLQGETPRVKLMEPGTTWEARMQRARLCLMAMERLGRRLVLQAATGVDPETWEDFVEAYCETLELMTVEAA